MAAWRVITQEYEGIEGRSSALWSRERALSLACDLINQDVTVVRVEGYGEEIPVEAIREWAEERGRRLREG